MGTTGRASHKKPESVEQKGRVRGRNSNEPDREPEGRNTENTQAETPFFPSMEEHIAVLNRIPFAAQKEAFLLRLHQTYGSRYVHRLLETVNVRAKLTVSDPNDVYEQEADRVADQVTRSIKNRAQRLIPEEEEEILQGKSSIRRQTPEEEELLQGKLDVQRQTPEEEELLQGKLDVQKQTPEEEELLQGKLAIQRQTPEEEELLQGKLAVNRQAPEEEEELQMQSAGGSATVANDIETRIDSARGGGHALADEAKRPMEQAFGADFGDVRVHTDAESDSLNKQLSARAFTTGQDVFFAEGQYSPGSADGQYLIAHELTHVVQQTDSSKLHRNGPEPVEAPELPELREEQRVVPEEERERIPEEEARKQREQIPEEAKKKGFWTQVGKISKTILNAVKDALWDLVLESLEELTELVGVFAIVFSLKSIYSALAEAIKERKRQKLYLGKIAEISDKLKGARIAQYLKNGLDNTGKRLKTACLEITERVTSLFLDIAAIITAIAGAPVALVFAAISLGFTIAGWLGKQIKKFIGWIAGLLKKDKKKEYAEGIISGALTGAGEERKLAAEIILKSEIETPEEYISWFNELWLEEEHYATNPPISDIIDEDTLHNIGRFFGDPAVEPGQKAKVKEQLIENVSEIFVGYIY
jgi:hypothetical protein